MTFYSLLKISLKILALKVFIYTYIRLQFYLWNLPIFSETSGTSLLGIFAQGLLFDVYTASLLLIPVTILLGGHFFQPGKRWLWLALFYVVVVSIPFFLINAIDIEYSNISGRRLIARDFFILNDVPGKTLEYVITYWKLALLNIPWFVAFIFWVKSILMNRQDSTANPEQLSRASVSFVVIGISLVLFSFLYVEGTKESLPPSVAFKSAPPSVSSFHDVLTLNTTLTILKTVRSDLHREEKFFQDSDQWMLLLNGAGDGASVLDGLRPKSPQNVVIFIMESFGQEYREHTPFLNELETRSLSFPRALANGRRSVDALPAIVSLKPALRDTAAIFSNRKLEIVPSLVRNLSDHGYETYFLHGGANHSMGFDKFCSSAGFKHCLGLNEYPNPDDHDGAWGVYDDLYFQYALGEMSRSKKPFFSTIFSLSSHHPYLVPGSLKGKFPLGPHEILESIGYSDYALRKFFEEAQKEPWYEDTLFIITADHTAFLYKKEFTSDPGSYHIPLVFFHPKFSWPHAIEHEVPVQQIDIMPSVLDFLGLEGGTYSLLSRSVFIPGPKGVATYHGGHYFYFYEESFLMWPRSSKNFLLFQWELGEGLTEPLDPSDLRGSMIRRLKASIQYFNEFDGY